MFIEAAFRKTVERVKHDLSSFAISKRLPCEAAKISKDKDNKFFKDFFR